MRIFLILILSIGSFHTSYSQTWVDNGATWHFGLWAPHMEGYLVYNYDRDTIVDGIDCQVITCDKHIFFDDGPDGEVINSLPINITYASGDTVFYRVGDDFFVLYDFGAEIGDSWIVSNGPEEDFVACDDTSRVEVAGVGVMEIDAVEYRYIDLVPSANSPKGLKGRFVERFGQTNTWSDQFHYLFPDGYQCEGIPDDVPTEFGYLKLICFEDDSFSLYNPTGESCIQVIGLPEIEESVSLNCYPNPASTELSINSSQMIDHILVYTQTGALISQIEVGENSTQIDVSAFARGIYLFDIRFNSGIIEKRNISIE